MAPFDLRLRGVEQRSVEAVKRQRRMLPSIQQTLPDGSSGLFGEFLNFQTDRWFPFFEPSGELRDIPLRVKLFQRWVSG